MSEIDVIDRALLAAFGYVLVSGCVVIFALIADEIGIVTSETTEPVVILLLGSPLAMAMGLVGVVFIKAAIEGNNHE